MASADKDDVVIEIEMRTRKLVEQVATLKRDIEAEMPNCRHRSIALTHVETAGLFIAAWGADEATKAER